MGSMIVSDACFPHYLLPSNPVLSLASRPCTLSLHQSQKQSSSSVYDDDEPKIANITNSNYSSSSQPFCAFGPLKKMLWPRGPRRKFFMNYIYKKIETPIYFLTQYKISQCMLCSLNSLAFVEVRRSCALTILHIKLLIFLGSLADPLTTLRGRIL